MLQGDSFVTKGAAANKTDAEEPAVRKSSKLAQNSPITFKHLFSPPETPLQFGQENTPIETPGYQPFARHYDEARCKEEDESLNKLNAFLASRDCSPARSRYRMKGMLSQAAERTKREHIRKVKQGIVSVIETIAPGQEGETWAELTCSGSLDAFFNVGYLGRLRLEADHSIQALAAAYRQSDAKLTKIQILSITIDIFPQQQIQVLLPVVTKYQLFQAKKHLLSCGTGQPLPAVPKYRVDLIMPKIDHFIGFISSPHFVQDVARGTRTLTLSSRRSVCLMLYATWLQLG